ncbi:MAG: anaerobic ribonucleoside-triphosphate reductase [Promethearchaeota archaeon]|jgi:ribonucleoside-triphosphate reductase
MDLLPKVFRTEGDLTEFNPSRIYDSILIETKLSEDNTKKITELVVRRIVSSGIKFLSGPHIREIVCSILSEQHFENERKLYTRIGMPLMDYEEILEKGLVNHPKRLVNPEKIHNWAANRISEEYAHLRILNSEESKAHLYGDIHIHKLRYFDLRPLTQIWDPRLILENGIPPIDDYFSCCKLKPAKNLREACQHLVKWLALTQNEICGSQGLYNITTYLAPYVQQLSEPDLNLIIKNFIYEMNYFSFLAGRNISPISILTCPSVVKNVLNIPAVGPCGESNGTYSDYNDECLKLFDSFTYNFLRDVESKNLLKTPKHEVLIDEALLIEFKDSYQKIWDEISTKTAPLLLNSKNYNSDEKPSEKIFSLPYDNWGILQDICINLPRFAYLSKDEDDFTDKIIIAMKLSSKILLKKYDVIKRRLESNHLPLFGSIVKDQVIFKLENQHLALSFIGLNEAIKVLTNHELHAHSSAFNLGRKILSEMRKVCLDLSKTSGISHLLSENVSKKTAFRFAKLDLKHFPKTAIPQTDGSSHFYTNSAHFREGAEINAIEKFEKQEEYQEFIQNGEIEYMSLNELKQCDLNYEDFIKRIFLPSKLRGLQFR